MALIFLHPRFPKTKKAYTKAGDENTEKLKQIMEKLTIQSKDDAPASSNAAVVPPRGASIQPWAYTDKKRGKSKTFKL